MANITIKRKTGATTYEDLLPTTTWANVSSRPNINGSSTAVSFYAPTSAGSNYQVLRSTATGAPVWTDTVSLITTASAGQNTNATLTFTSGMRDFIVQVLQDSTTSSYTIATLHLSMASTYSLSTTTRYYRATWFNGSVAQTIQFAYYYSGTTLYIQHNFNFTAGFRLYNLN